MYHKKIHWRLERTNRLFLDLLEFIPNEYLSSKLSNLPSNTIGQQLWCVIGARSSYLKAIKAGEWKGFECCLSWKETSNAERVKEALNSTFTELNSYLNNTTELEDSGISYLIDLLEHEVQHHGQLIRYLYGLKLGVPKSWQDRYNLD